MRIDPFSFVLLLLTLTVGFVAGRLTSPRPNETIPVQQVVYPAQPIGSSAQIRKASTTTHVSNEMSLVRQITPESRLRSSVEKLRFYKDLMELGTHSPEAAEQAAEWIRDNAHEDYVGSKSLRTFVNSWAGRSPVDVLKWYESLPTGFREKHRLPTMGLIYKAAGEDPDAVAQWLGKQQGRVDYDQAVLAFLVRAAKEDTSLAMQWADTISSDSVHERAVRLIEENGATLNFSMSLDKVSFKLASDERNQ